jgi:hypothetical protein
MPTPSSLHDPATPPSVLDSPIVSVEVRHQNGTVSRLTDAQANAFWLAVRDSIGIAMHYGFPFKSPGLRVLPAPSGTPGDEAPALEEDARS